MGELIQKGTIQGCWESVIEAKPIDTCNVLNNLAYILARMNCPVNQYSN